MVSVLALSGLLTAPFGIPLLPVETFIAYQRFLGVAPVAAERSALGPLPQHFADRFGWEEMSAAVAEVYKSLSESRGRSSSGRTTGRRGPFATSDRGTVSPWR